MVCSPRIQAGCCYRSTGDACSYCHQPGTGGALACYPDVLPVREVQRPMRWFWDKNDHVSSMGRVAGESYLPVRHH